MYRCALYYAHALQPVPEPHPIPTSCYDLKARTARKAKKAAKKAKKASATKAADAQKPADANTAEKAEAEEAAALGLLQPLEALSLDADSLRAATVAAVTYCDAQGATSFADLVERASKLIANSQATILSRPGLLSAPYRRRGTCCWRRLPCYDPYATPSLRMSAEIRTLSNHAGTTYSTG